jgi:hypothetical protein
MIAGRRNSLDYHAMSRAPARRCFLSRSFGGRLRFRRCSSRGLRANTHGAPFRVFDFERICPSHQIAWFAKVLGSKSEARLASCLPTSPRSTYPSSLSIYVITFLMIGAAAPGGRRGFEIETAQTGDKPRALFQHRTRFPRHSRLPLAKSETCNPCVRYEMSPMSRAAHDLSRLAFRIARCRHRIIVSSAFALRA